MADQPTSAPVPQTPFLLVIEGIDGAGKTTIAGKIADELRRCGLRTLASKEPTQGVYGQQLRESAATGRLNPTQELELLLLDRKQHVDGLLKPALDAGSIIILDRYYFSNVAYQGAEGISTESILDANESFAPHADLVLLLDVSPDIGLARIASRGDFANHFERPETLKRCREIFLSIDRPEIRLVDAAAPLDDVFSEAMQLLVAAYAEKVAKHHGLTVQGVEALLPLLSGAYREHAVA